MRFTTPVVLVNPGAPTKHPRTGNPVPGEPSRVDVLGELQPLQTTTEAGDGSQTVIAGWVLLLPPGSPVTAATTVEALGMKFEVVGRPPPINQGSGIPSHIHVTLSWVSDLQEAS